MIFEVQGKTEKYIKLSKDEGSKGIEFLASRKLVEYEIQMEDLVFQSTNNISQGVVKFVFRRNMEFHVTNTFLQTFLLVCVGYFSYYFDVDNFSDRIMVVLTTMLVVATITTSIQDVKPISFKNNLKPPIDPKICTLQPSYIFFVLKTVFSHFGHFEYIFYFFQHVTQLLCV